jgi:putative tryptophan/tyrosine transport system substrate-binding protein
MTTVGIMHSGSQDIATTSINAFLDRLKNDCKTQPTIYGPYFPAKGQTLEKLAQSVIDMKVDILIAAGGSRSAKAAIATRGTANKPIIVFTSVDVNVINGLDRSKTGGVCAHTSDHDVDRLDWLLELPFKGRRIGVLWNSNRDDKGQQKKDIDAELSKTKCTPVYRDINGTDTVKDIFDLFKGDIHALLVAADSFFGNDRKEIEKFANADIYPAIFQWREFVELGGLMSYGPNLNYCYNQAGAITAEIVNGTASPPYRIWEPNDPNDYELCVSAKRAADLKLKLPTSITTSARYVPLP